MKQILKKKCKIILKKKIRTQHIPFISFKLGSVADSQCSDLVLTEKDLAAAAATAAAVAAVAVVAVVAVEPMTVATTGGGQFEGEGQMSTARMAWHS